MRCDELRTLLHGYVDGELDLMGSLEIERHLEGCSACANTARQQRALKQALADPALYHRAPADLAERLRASLRPPRAPRGPAPVLPWRALAVAAALAFLALLAWDVLRARFAPVAEEPQTRQVVANHVRSLLADHLLDMASSEKHKLKPWFNGRVPFAVPVEDFKNEGYPLAGGRVDVLDNGNVAALVYKHNQHIINVFIAPASGEGDEPPQGQTVQEYHLFRWTRRGMAYWVISDLNEQDLRNFVELLRPS